MAIAEEDMIDILAGLGTKTFATLLFLRLSCSLKKSCEPQNAHINPADNQRFQEEALQSPKALLSSLKKLIKKKKNPKAHLSSKKKESVDIRAP